MVCFHALNTLTGGWVPTPGGDPSMGAKGEFTLNFLYFLFFVFCFLFFCFLFFSFYNDSQSQNYWILYYWQIGFWPSTKHHIFGEKARLRRAFSPSWEKFDFCIPKTPYFWRKSAPSARVYPLLGEKARLRRRFDPLFGEKARLRRANLAQNLIENQSKML